MFEFSNSNVFKSFRSFQIWWFWRLMHERKLLVYCAQNDHKKKHNKVTLKTKYETLEEFDKKRPNKEATIQFNIPRSTLSTWNQPISSSFCWIDCFWIFWKTYRSNYRRGWWKWRWRIQWRNCTLLKKWSWQGNQNFKQIKSVHRGFKYWSFNLKTDPHNQSVKKWGYHQ